MPSKTIFPRRLPRSGLPSGNRSNPVKPKNESDLPEWFDPISRTITKSRYSDHHEAAVKLAKELGIRNKNHEALLAAAKKREGLLWVRGISTLQDKHGFKTEAGIDAALGLMEKKEKAIFNDLHACFALRHGLENAKNKSFLN